MDLGMKKVDQISVTQKAV